MKVCVLASGSKGNSTYISTSNNNILIDLGITSLAVEKRMIQLGIDPSCINAILITHTHTDHIGGLKVFLKKYHPKVYLTDKMYDDLQALLYDNEYEIITEDFYINDTFIQVVKTSHDASDSNGYILNYEDKSVVYITDTGYIHKRHHDKLKNHNVYIFESNHDVEKLRHGKYPYYLQQRILGDEGHLSNQDSSYYLANFVGNKTDHIILAHLSEENNTEELAYETLRKILKKHHKQVSDIQIAKQNEQTGMIEI